MIDQETIPRGTGTDGAFGFARNGYDTAEARMLSTSDIEGATVYGRDDEIIESVTSLKIRLDGDITAAVIDVGGFLGMGVHSVLVPFSQLTVLRKTSGPGMWARLDTTKDKLKAMPHHEG